MKLSYNEIKSWRDFEDLVASYFSQLNLDNGVIEVDVKPSGIGADEGRDILVTFKMNDTLVSFTRTWVVQCKSYNRTLGLKDIAGVNIPTLIHAYGADGYLLVSKSHVSSSITKTFERLQQNCRFNYQYVFWQGNSFLDKIITADNILRVYFPKFYSKTKKEERAKKV